MIPCLLVLGLIGGVEQGYAEESMLNTFNIEGVQNENQIDPDAGYFYLHEEPGATDEIKVKVNNTSNEEKSLQLPLSMRIRIVMDSLTIRDKYPMQKYCRIH